MKNQYENRTRYMLPRRTYTIVRCDGKAFHTYTRNFQKPYDVEFNVNMDQTAYSLLKIVDGAQFVYTQSDEISLLLTDFKELDTQAWFDGNLQKIVSVAASACGAKLSQLRPDNPPAIFDARAFTINDINEVANYFLWRTRDCIRNSISSLGQHYFSQTQLHGKNTSEVQEMLYNKDVNWNNFEPRFKTGSLQTRNDYLTIPEKNLFDFYKALIPKLPT